MSCVTNPWWWHRWISFKDVTQEIEADPEYERLQYLIANKNATRDIEALKSAILNLHDLCENIALAQFHNRRDLLVVALNLLSAVCAVVFVMVRINHGHVIVHGLSAICTITLLVIAAWVWLQTPAIMQDISSTKPIRAAATLKNFLENFGYTVSITPD